ncbi:hypothetical protein ACFL59_12020 [Planctomycetota bacterium]
MSRIAQSRNVLSGNQVATAESGDLCENLCSTPGETNRTGTLQAAFELLRQAESSPNPTAILAGVRALLALVAEPSVQSAAELLRLAEASADAAPFVAGARALLEGTISEMPEDAVSRVVGRVG